MRFSDMMNTEDDRSPKPPATPHAVTEIADALTPYLGRSASATPVEQGESVESVELVDPVDVVATEPAEPAEPLAAAAAEDVHPEEPVAMAPDSPHVPIAARVADFTPLSDDLLPHRR